MDLHIDSDSLNVALCIGFAVLVVVCLFVNGIVSRAIEARDE